MAEENKGGSSRLGNALKGGAFGTALGAALTAGVGALAGYGVSEALPEVENVANQDELPARPTIELDSYHNVQNALNGEHPVVDLSADEKAWYEWVKKSDSIDSAISQAQNNLEATLKDVTGKPWEIDGDVRKSVGIYNDIKDAIPAGTAAVGGAAGAMVGSVAGTVAGAVSPTEGSWAKKIQAERQQMQHSHGREA